MAKKTKKDEELKQDKHNKEEKGLGDLLKKISSLSGQSGLVSEENIKNFIKDIPIAKELAKETIVSALENAKGAKGEVSKLMQDEFRKYLGKVEIEKIVDYLAENYDIDAKLSFKKKKKDSNDTDH